MGTWIVGLVILGIAGFALRSLVSNKDPGDHCGGCSGCGKKISGTTDCENKTLSNHPKK